MHSKHTLHRHQIQSHRPWSLVQILRIDCPASRHWLKNHVSPPVLISKSPDKSVFLQSNSRFILLPKTPYFDVSYTADPLPAPAVLLYQSLSGDLCYLADITHIDISFAVSWLTQHLMKTTTQHMPPHKHCLWYFSGTKSHGNLFQQSNDVLLSSYSDADYSAASDRRSTTSHLHISFGAPIALCSKNNPHLLAVPAK